MKLAVGKSQLWSGIDTVLDAVATKPALPILSNILVAADNEHLTLAATDLDLSIRTRVPANVSQKGQLTVPARTLAGIAREWPEAEISLEVVDDRLLLSGKLGDQDAGEGAYTLGGIAPEEFPEVPVSLEGVTIDLTQLEENALPLGEMIAKTSFAVSRDETRPVLNGVLWHLKADACEMVATDGHRLAHLTRQVAFNGAISDEDGKEAILPPQACSQVVKLLGAGKSLQRVTIGESQVLFDFGDTHLLSRLIEGPYVDFRQVIPQQNTKDLRLDKERLLPAVRRVSLLSSSYTHQIRMAVDKESIELTAASQEIGGEAKERIPCSYAHDAQDVGYNANYLLEILRKIDDDEVVFDLKDAVTAALIRPGAQAENEEYYCLLMPLRPSG